MVQDSRPAAIPYLDESGAISMQLHTFATRIAWTLIMLSTSPLFMLAGAIGDARTGSPSLPIMPLTITLAMMYLPACVLLRLASVRKRRLRLELIDHTRISGARPTPSNLPAQLHPPKHCRRPRHLVRS